MLVHIYNSTECGTLVCTSLARTKVFQRNGRKLMTYIIQPIICIELATVCILDIHMATNNTDRRRTLHTVL
jgi:hypothetical protein